MMLQLPLRLPGSAPAVILAALAAACAVPPQPPLRVTLTRLAPEELTQHHFAAAIAPALVAAAGWLGIDLFDGRMTWQVEQDVGAYALRVELALLVDELRPVAMILDEEGRPW